MTPRQPAPAAVPGERARFVVPPEERADTASQDTTVPPLADEPPLPSAQGPYPGREGPDDETSQFDPAPPFRSRRNTLRMWTWAAALFAAVAAATILVVSYFGLPEWVPVSRPTFGLAQPELQLDFPPDQQERRQLPNGTEFFGASGTITNIGSQARQVPPILIVLRDGQDRIVYSWEVNPPRRSLAPGESVTVNEAVTDVPRSARVAEIGWKPD